jgi:predicted transcriptional regulator
MIDKDDGVTMAAELTAAWLSNPHTRASVDEVATFLATIHKSVSDLGGSAAPTPEPEAAANYEPAVSARRSLASPEHIISMIDGKKYRSLTRHLSSKGLTPAEYRQRYGLKADYPMVAPAYSEARRAMAKTIGLGRKAGTKVEKAAGGAAKSARKGGKAALAAARKALGTEDGASPAPTDQS